MLLELGREGVLNSVISEIWDEFLAGVLSATLLLNVPEVANEACV